MTQHVSNRPQRATLIMLALAVAMALLVLILFPRLLSGADDVWVAPLRAQLKAEQGCDLAFIVTQRELQLGNEKKLEGRIRCGDGREYDFVRSQPHLKFEVKLCQPTFC